MIPHFKTPKPLHLEPQGEGGAASSKLSHPLDFRLQVKEGYNFQMGYHLFLNSLFDLEIFGKNRQKSTTKRGTALECSRVAVTQKYLIFALNIIYFI